jgi:hypothetical protein
METKICIRCGKEYVPNSNRQKYCMECGVVAYKEYSKQYYKQYDKQYYKVHKEERKEYDKQYYQNHPEQVAEKQKRYRKTPAGKEADKRGYDKHRKLGFKPINEYFEGSEGHHIDKERIIYIPKELHKSIWHNLNTGQGMVEINFKVMQWLERGCNVIR